MAAKLGPGQNNLRGGNCLTLSRGEALGDGLHFGLVDQERHAYVVVSEGGVGRDEDVLLGAIIDHGRVGEPGVALDLVHSGHDAGIVDDRLELPSQLET